VTHTPARAAGAGGGPPPAARRNTLLNGPARLRAAAVTEPGRLRFIGTLLAAVLLAFGAVAAWQVTGRVAAADDVVGHSGRLNVQAAEIYRSLADANTMAATGFLAGGQEPPAVREQYGKDIGTASRLIAVAATSGQGSPGALARIELLSRRLPVYTGLVETARTYNRDGLPLGAAYLRYANEQMQQDGGLLDAASELYEIETGRLGRDYTAAKAPPWGAWVLGSGALGGLMWAQRRSYQRTNRVFSQGLLTGSAATAVALLWLVVGHAAACVRLNDSYQHGARSLQVLSRARIESLQARGNENLTLVARGSGDAYNNAFVTEMTSLAGRNAEGRSGLLARALDLADDAKVRRSVATAEKHARAWWSLHRRVRAEDDAGSYDDAVAKTIGGTTAIQWTGAHFNSVDASLRAAIDHEQGQFEAAATDGRDALSGLAVGAAVLAVLGATGTALGIGRRLSEYR
jgi:hypothetical protein